MTGSKFSQLCLKLDSIYSFSLLVLTSLYEETKNFLSNHQQTKSESKEFTELDELKTSLEMVIYLFYWALMVAERHETSKLTQINATKLPKSKAKNNKSSFEDDEFSWESQKKSSLTLLSSLLRLDLNRIWTMMNERAPFISLFLEIAYLMFETDVNIKVSALKYSIFEILSICASNYDQAHNIQVTIMQNLRYSTHLSECMADLIHYTTQANCYSLIEVTLKDFGQIQFQSDDRSAKEFSKFIIRLTDFNSQDVHKYLSYFSQHIDSESYTIRCAMIECFGLIIGRYLVQNMNENATNHATNLCMALEERLLDMSSYCRARTLKTFCYLSDVSSDDNIGSGARRNAIPLLRRPMVIDGAIGRLFDKTSNVRREAIRFLCKVVETHPFWLDGGVLDLAFFKKRLEAIDQKLQNVVPEDFIAELERALPADAREKLKKDRGEDSMEKPKDESSNSTAVSSEELEGLYKKQRYYQDAIKFVEQINQTIPIMIQLLASKTKSDVIECIQFFVEAFEHGVIEAQTGLKSMVHLVWSKDTGDSESKSIREHLVQAYYHLYVDIGAQTEKDAIKIVVRNLITLTFRSTVAELTSLEQLLSIMMSKGMISDEIINHLWAVYANTKLEIPPEQRRGAIIILGMLAKERKETISDHLQSLMRIGLSEPGHEDLLLCKYSCIALQKLAPVKKQKGVAPDETYRLPISHPLFKMIKDSLLRQNYDIEWFGMAEQMINSVYLLADQPDKIASSIIRDLNKITFTANDQNEHETSQSSMQNFEHKESVDTTDLAKLLFVAGHIAIKQIVHMEKMESELKRRQPGDSSAPVSSSKQDDDDELNEVVGNCEDDIGDTMYALREQELLGSPDALLNIYAPIAVAVCSDKTKFPNPILQRMSTLALTKFMCVSESFCQQNLQLLFTILEKTKDATVRSNIIVALGDMVVCFNNLIEQNISYLYNRLRDSDVAVKKNALMVLTHLILNGMVKVKGQIGQMAMCLEDEDVKISNLSRLFFTELSTKDNAIYNNLPDIISNLSNRPELTESQYRSIMKFLFGFVEKDRQTENVVEKLCQRFREAVTPRQWREISYCLSLIPYNSEKSVKKLVDNLGFYQDKLHEETVYKFFAEIIAKTKKFQKADMKEFVEEFEKKVNGLHAGR